MNFNEPVMITMSLSFCQEIPVRLKVKCFSREILLQSDICSSSMSLHPCNPIIVRCQMYKVGIEKNPFADICLLEISVIGE